MLAWLCRLLGNGLSRRLSTVSLYVLINFVSLTCALSSLQGTLFNLATDYYNFEILPGISFARLENNLRMINSRLFPFPRQ